ncbi:MAG: hypothetical protein JSV36_08020, partial [Anaerolineae bacterium]
PGDGPRPQGEPGEIEAAASSHYIPIQGRLTDSSGTPLDGSYDVTFRLYEVSSGGTAVCEDTRSVSVENGLFSHYFQGCSKIDGRQLYLGVQVEADPEMSPRQYIDNVPYAWSLRPGAIISGTLGSNAIVHIENWGSGGRGLRSYAMDTSGTNYGVVGASRSPDGYGGYFYNNGGGDALYGKSTESSGGDGVTGESYSASGRGVYARNYGSGVAIAGYSDSVPGTGHWYPTLYLVQANSSGDFVVGASAYWGSRYWRVDRTGKGYFNGGTQASGADFAEQLAVEGEEADYEPGDVLVISASADRTVELSSEPFATAVIGVYSTRPAVRAGAPDTDDPLAGIPVAITGIAPCKASAENGPIQRGDLLVTSSTPGHAMRAGDSPAPGTVLGKAMQPLESGTGIIEVLVTLQ